LPIVSIVLWFAGFVLVSDSLSPSALGSLSRAESASAYSDDVNGGFQRDVNKRSGDVNKVAERSDAGMGIMPETIDGNQGGE
jgi:hypothetical protein